MGLKENFRFALFPPYTCILRYIYKKKKKKKVIEIEQTWVWSVTNVPLSDSITGVPPFCPFLERKSLMVGQKYLDFGPPAQRS